MSLTTKPFCRRPSINLIVGSGKPALGFRHRSSAALSKLAKPNQVCTHLTPPRPYPIPATSQQARSASHAFISLPVSNVPNFSILLPQPRLWASRAQVTTAASGPTSSISNPWHRAALGAEVEKGACMNTLSPPRYSRPGTRAQGRQADVVASQQRNLSSGEWQRPTDALRELLCQPRSLRCPLHARLPLRSFATLPSRCSTCFLGPSKQQVAERETYACTRQSLSYASPTRRASKLRELPGALSCIRCAPTTPYLLPFLAAPAHLRRYYG